MHSEIFPLVKCLKRFILFAMAKTLVVIDMQNDFIDGPLGNEYAKNVVLPNIVNKIKNGEFDNIVFTMDTHQKNYLETFEGKQIPVPHCIENSHGWELHKDLNNLLDYDNNVIKGTNKHFMIKTKETFGATGLLFAINQINSFEAVDTIELCGVCTDICVVSNALILRNSAPSVRIVCDSSCCGGTTKDAHEAALLVMKSCQIEIV